MLQYDPPHAYFVEGERVGLDAKAETTFLSHAHLDHFFSVAKSKTILASKATLDLLRARGKKMPAEAKEQHQNGVKIQLLNAGHVLGSRMLLAQGEQTFLYTSDFLAEDSLTQKAAEPIDADVLLVECTYGLPEYCFPNRWSVYEQIGKWANQQQKAGYNAVIGAYSVGKAQEVIKALNQASIAPLVSKNIGEINAVYEKHGVALEYVRAESSEGKEALQKPFIAIMPMHQVNTELHEGLAHAYSRKTRISVATGWTSRLAGSVDQAFCLSDHNDFKVLVEFIEACCPKNVYCTHGPAEEFAAELRKKGIAAKPIERLSEKQKTLEPFSAYRR